MRLNKIIYKIVFILIFVILFFTINVYAKYKLTYKLPIYKIQIKENEQIDDSLVVLKENNMENRPIIEIHR